MKPMLRQDNSIYKFQCTMFLKLGSHYPPLRGIVPNSLWLLDNSTKKLQCALLLKFESHYNLPIPLRCAFGIGVSTIKIKNIYRRRLAGYKIWSFTLR